MTKHTIPIRSDPKFAEEIKRIQLQRIKNGKEEPLKPIRKSRITLAMTRHPEFKRIKRDIINADIR